MMHEKMMKMLEKKKAKKLSPVEQKAKMGVLKELKDDMSSEMGGSLKDMMAKKVSVMAGNKEDLEKGLDKAKELVHDMPNGEEGQLEDMEAEESGEAGMAEAADDVEAEIKKLEQKLAKLKAMKGESEEEESEDESEEA
jgi:hypothetical protein